MYANKLYSSFSLIIHIYQTYKEIQNKNHVKSTPKFKVSITMYRISHGFGLWAFIIEQSDSVNIVFYSQFPMVSGIILRTFMIFINISDENKIRGKTTIANQWTWVQNHLYIFISLVNKDQRVKNSLRI